MAALAVPLAAAAETDYTPRRAAKQLATDYLAPLVRPDSRPVTVTARPCRKIGRWYGCRVIVRGRTTCRAIVHVLEPLKGEYTGWVPRMRCR